MYAGSHGSTFGGNPLALAVGNVVLDELLDPSFLPNVRKISVYMRSKLEYLAERYPSVIDAITGKGLMLGININSKYDAELMFEIGLSNNVICMPASGNILRVTPPLIITQKHIDEMTDKLEAVIKKSMKTGSMVMEGLKKKLKKVLS
jgi:acetylornithine/N-succinyldiaminopimelate aminotransferase